MAASKAASLQERIHFVDATAGEAVLCQAPTWSLSRPLLSKLDRLQHKMYSQVVKVRKGDLDWPAFHAARAHATKGVTTVKWSILALERWCAWWGHAARCSYHPLSAVLRWRSPVWLALRRRNGLSIGAPRGCCKAQDIFQ